MNVTNAIPDLDALGPSLNMLHSTDPRSISFLHRGQTQEQLIQMLAHVVYQPLPKRIRIWLLASEFEVITTFLVCSIMLIKRKTLGRLWIFTKRESIYGTFLVSNAVFVLVLGVAVYLVSWDITALVIAAFSFTEVSTMEWWWVIPLPWTPLVVCAYVSAHGFVLGCSPRSPLASVRANNNNVADRNKWYYLPVLRKPWLANVALIVPTAAFCANSLALVIMSGRQYYQAKALVQHLLPADIALQLKAAAFSPTTFYKGADVLASDELIWQARRIAAAYLEVHRYVSINLTVFAFAAMLVWVPYIIYAVPNLMSLVDHACSRNPDPLPSNCTNFPRKMWFLLTKGKPTSEKSTTHHNIGTWKMTILASIYVGIMVVCVPSFGWLPMFIVGGSYPKLQRAGDITQEVSVAVFSVSVITILSCTFVALFCTVATLDPVFRAAIGLNVLRNQVPIDIQVVQHRTQHEDIEPFGSSKDPITLNELLGTRPRTLAVRPSSSTLNADSVKSPTYTNEYPHYPVDADIHIAADDIKLDTNIKRTTM